MSAVLIGIEVGCRMRELGPERRTQNEAPAAQRSRLRLQPSLNLARPPNQNSTPKRSENPLGPSQGAWQVNQATPRQQQDHPDIQ
jgi:hypothetical protein